MKYKERHCIVEPTVVCEIKDLRGVSYLFRLKIKWQQKRSKISKEAISNVGVWTTEEGKFNAVLAPYRGLGLKSTKIEHEFDLAPIGEIPQMQKRELSAEIITELSDKTRYNIADKDHLETEDYFLAIHGTAGQDLLKKLQITKKAVIGLGLKVKSSVFGDIIHGVSRTAPISPEEIQKRKDRANNLNTYVNYQTLCGDEDPFVPKEGELFFPSWMLEKQATGEVTTIELNSLIKSYLEQQLQDFTEWDLKREDYDKEVMDRFRKNRTRTPDGRYVTYLPWNEKTANVSGNRKIALDRLKSLERDFKKDPSAYGRYKEALDKMIEAKVIVKVDEEYVKNCKKAVFFPHHAVYKPERETTKTRVVWDGGAHEANKNSINQCLESGPNLLPPLQCLLMRSRQGRYICTADLKQAFFQVALADDDIIQLFMYWLEEVPGKPGEFEIAIYRFVRLPWGLNCSPFILQAAIKCHGEDIIATITNDEEQVKIIREILISLYIDDLIKTFNDPAEITKVLAVAFSMLESAGWEITKIRSNCEEINKKYNIDPKTLEGLKLLTHKVLGILYDGEKDTIRPNLANIESLDLSKPISRRIALSGLAKFYDPLKLLAPWTFQGQLLFQETQRLEKSWDKPLEISLRKRWEKFFSSYKLLESFSVPREIIPYRQDFTVHVFSDASKLGLAAVGYVVWHERKICNLLTAMTKIVPDSIKEETTSNRLELMSAGVSIKLKQKIDGAFPGVKIDYTYWMDSMVSLWWIYSSKVPFKIFVSNRVENILEHSDRTQWRHIAGKENPADIASRGAEAEKLLDPKNLNLWTKGPEWLLDEKLWPKHFHEPEPMNPIEQEGYMQEVNSRNSMALQYLPAHVHTFEKFFKPLAYSPKQFPILALATVHVARWIGRNSYGPMYDMYESYMRNRPIYKLNQEHHWDRWKEGLRIYNLKKWYESLERPRHSKRESISFVSRVKYTKINPPPSRRTQVDPEEYNIARDFLLRETQSHHLEGIYHTLRLNRPDDLTIAESRLVHKYQIRYDSSDQLLKVHGRVISPKEDHKLIEPSLEQVVGMYYTKVKRDRKLECQVTTRSQNKPIKRDHSPDPNETDSDTEDWEIKDRYSSDEEKESIIDSEPEEPIDAQENSLPPHEEGMGEDFLTTEEKELLEEFAEALAEDQVNLKVPLPSILKKAHHFEELVLIPDQGVIAESLVRSAHVKCGHGGVHQTMRELREEFWIMHPTKLYNQIKKSCFICRFFTNKLWLIQEGNMPIQSKTVSYPFEYVGIDIAGPLFKVKPIKKVKIKGKIVEQETITEDDEVKASYYALLIVCANTRAVDLQLMTRMSAEAVCMAFEAFIHARGKPKYVLSDNAGCFQSLNKAYLEATALKIEKKHTGIKWKFIPARSAWWGGQYEIFVRMMKTVMYKLCPNLRVKDQLSAYYCLKEIEFCLNTRPLYGISNDVNDMRVGTPFKYIRVGYELESKYDPLDPNLTKEVAHRILTSQSKQIKELWYQVQQEYLNTQRAYRTDQEGYNQPPPKIGDLVMIKVDRKARNFWPIARITELLPNKATGIVRKVRLQKYCPYEINFHVRNLKYPGVTESRMTAKQLRELRGYFKDQKYTYDLRNLCPFEVWKGEADVHVPQSQAIRILEQIAYLSVSKRMPSINMFSLDPLPIQQRREDFLHPTARATGLMTYEEPSYEVWVHSDSLDPRINEQVSEFQTLYGHIM
jgi:hypothetical protein